MMMILGKRDVPVLSVQRLVNVIDSCAIVFTHHCFTACRPLAVV